MTSATSPRADNLRKSSRRPWIVVGALLAFAGISARLHAQESSIAIGPALRTDSTSQAGHAASPESTAYTNRDGSEAKPESSLDSNADGAPDANTAKFARVKKIPPPDFNEEIYYRNKLEYSQELGVLPINIPFVFDIFVGSEYDQKPLHYTLVPVEPSLRWQMGKLNGPWFLRGNTEMELSPTFTSVVRGPESRYEAFVLGFRRNFVPRNSRPTAYFDFRMGAGWIDAQEPHGVMYAQGQDFTFTLQMGSGCRYNFSPKYGMSLGFNYMHVSNLYLSEPKYPNNGINVWGPQAGFYVRLGKPKQPHAS